MSDETYKLIVIGLTVWLVVNGMIIISQNAGLI